MIITEVAFLIIKADPPHLEANLDYVIKYRHPTLLGAEVLTYLLVIRVAVSLSCQHGLHP